jgi:predicted nicotinamide N-methyase
MTDVQWKEYNPEFGDHNIKHHNEDANDAFHTMEFELESIPKITLRGKAKISESTGLTIWTCSQILFGYLDDHPGLVAGKNVLELGAGLGLCSIAAHHLGAKRVLATDGDVDVLENLRYNIDFNIGDADATSESEDTSKRIQCPQLVWGEEMKEFEDKYDKPDVIIGTDVLYFTRNLEPLWQTINALLKPDGKFLLSFVTHSVTVAEILEAARHYGFKWKKPNISGNSDGEEEKEEDYTSSNEFGYHIFIFSRE